MKVNKSTIYRVVAFIFLVEYSVSSYPIEYGVCTHFAHGKGSYNQFFSWAKGSEFNSYRDEIYWSQVEKQIGVFNLSGPTLDSYKSFKAAKRNGFNPIVILGYGNSLYDGGGQPRTQNAISGYVNYAIWIAKLLKNSVDYYEIWNEWNLGMGSSPKVRYGDPKEYAALAKAAYPQIKKVNPNSKVIVGALGDDANGYPWLKSVIDEGLLKYSDGISIHLYNHCMGEKKAGADEAINRLREVQEILRKSNGGKSFPIYVTEVGWPTNSGKCAITENVSSEQSARFLLESKSITDIAGIWWYEFFDGGNDPQERENRFGLLRSNLEEKPTGCRLKSIQGFIKNASVEKKLSKNNATVTIFKNNDGRRLISMWAGTGYSDVPQTIKLRGILNEISKFNVDCSDRVNADVPKYSSTEIEVEISTYPKLFWIDNKTDIISID